MKGLLALPLVLVTAHIVHAQAEHVTPLPSKPDIEKAIADEPRGSATGGWLVWFIHDGKLGGGQWQVPPQIPHF